jgi:hypothetical protein
LLRATVAVSPGESLFGLAAVTDRRARLDDPEGRKAQPH